MPGIPAQRTLGKLLDSQGPRLYRLALRLCHNEADAADMVQDVFLQAYRKWHTFEGRANPGTWLYAIAARACKARTRRKGGVDRRMPSFSQVAPWRESTVADLPVADPGASPATEAVRRESTRAVRDAILALPEHFRVPLLFKEVLELSVEDVAEALGMKPETVKTRVHRARLALRKAILSRLPRREAPAPIYEKQVCVDLLRAKLEAMDRGRGFPIGREVLCERCRAVFGELDLAQDTCAHLADGPMPERVRAAVVRLLNAGRASPPQSARPRG